VVEVSLQTNCVQTFLFFAARTVHPPPPLPHNIVFYFYFYLEYPDRMITTNELRVYLATFGTQVRVIEALFAEGIYMVQMGHDGPTTSGCDKMMTKDERRKRGPSEGGTHAHLPKSSHPPMLLVCDPILVLSSRRGKTNFINRYLFSSTNDG